MYLDQITIHNFRSIRDATISLNKHCRILLGKNEAGKSNVLKAIAAVFGEYSVSAKDKRKKIDNEKIDSYYIRAVLKLSDEDLSEIVNRFSEVNILSFEDGVSVMDFAKAVLSDFLICLKIGDGETPYYSYWRFDENKYKTTVGSISIKDGIAALFECAKTYYKDNSFICHYWQYSENYLLPLTVKISEFISKPTSCRGLRNLFILCDRENIKKEFEDALAQDGDYINLLEQVSSKVTSTFRSIWPDFKDTSIQLIPNGPEISIKVTNKARYSFADRSDGFKRFISILLMLSAPSKKGKIGERDIILIDEPDASLYPSSARYLREELLRMGKVSYVVYATHSQYMIDADCIERHLIVEKNNDITTLKSPDSKAEFSEDELLLNAIGTSIFECIRPHNIVFEGWLDKKLFDFYLEQDKTLKKAFKDYGRVYLHGISGAFALCQLLILSGKCFIVVSDSDETSSNKRKDFVKHYPEYENKWRAYADIVSGISTVEDFLKPEYVENYIKENVEGAFTYNYTKSVVKNLESVTKEKERIQEIKVALITQAKKENIRIEEYKTYLKGILV